jgi:hypothetical protein
MSRAAETLAGDEQLLWDLADEMDPKMAIYGSMALATSRPLAFTPAGMEYYGSCSRS